jgi:hypothetical protein
MRGLASRIWKTWTNPSKIDGATTNEVCPCCKGRVYVHRSEPGEVVVATLSLLLMFAIAIPLFWVTEQWVERQSHRILDRMIIWREPTDSWNL